jgi:DNA-directed RNA polymerase beta subunit
MSKVEDNLVGEIMEMCKVTISGPGGIPINSVNIDNKNIHDSFYGIIDPIFTPDGDKCGVINYLVITAQINDDGTFNRD